MKNLFYSLLLSLFTAVGAHAQTVEGDWQGTLKAVGGELRLVLHVTKDEKGGLKATLDSVDQNSMGMLVTAISLTDATLKFEMKQIAGSFEGTIDKALNSISGTWTQMGNSLPLTLKRKSASPGEKKPGGRM